MNCVRMTILRRICFFFILASNSPLINAIDRHHNSTFNIIQKTFVNNTSPFSLWPFSLDSPSWYNIVLTFLFVVLYEKQLTKFWVLLKQLRSFRNIWFVLRKFIKTVVGLGISLTLASLFSPIYVLLQSYKRIFMFLLRIQFGNSFCEPLGNDAVWGTGSKTEKPFILALLKFEGKIDLEYFQNFITQNVINYRHKNGSRPFRKFKQTFQKHYGYFVWRDVDRFDLNKHVRVVDLEDVYSKEEIEKTKLPESSSCSEALICRYITEFGSECLPLNLPQWEMILIEQGDTNNEFTMLIKLHHAVGDGVALIRLLLEVLADTPTSVNLMGPPPHPVVRYLTTLWSIVLVPFAFLFLFQWNTKNPLHGKELTGKKMYVTSKSIPLSTVKRIKEKEKAAVTDVLFSCLSAAFAKHFQKLNEEIPTITIVFPIGFEDATAPLSLSNTFSYGVADIPTPSDVTLGKRVTYEESKTSGKLGILRKNEVKKCLDMVKEDPTILSIFWITSFLCSVLPSFLIERVVNTRGKTIGVSNLPGPKSEISVLKRKVVEMRFWVPDRAPTGLGFAIMSYNDQLRVSFNADLALIGTREEAEDIINDFVAALTQLEKEVINSNT